MAAFEEIDSTYDHVLEDDCDIQICEEPNFVELAPINYQQNREYEPTIGKTLENIGKIVVVAMFSENKKDIVQILMKIFDIELQYTQPFSLMNEQMHNLHVIYQDKYMYLKQSLEKYKTYIFQIIRECIHKCSTVIREMQEQTMLLKASATKIVSKIDKRDFMKINIVKEEYQKVYAHMKKEYESVLKFIKMQFEIKEYKYDEDEFLLQKNIELVKASANISPDNLNMIKEKYESEVKNLEFHISKEIQYECEQYWMEAIGVPK